MVSVERKEKTDDETTKDSCERCCASRQDVVRVSVRETESERERD